ncbi:hypothetical protein Emed_001193 [Eimeria media]
MALPAADGSWELAPLPRIPDVESTASATAGLTFVEEQKGGVLHRNAQKISKPLVLNTVFAVTVTSLLVVYTILRCFQNVSIGLTRTAAPRALAEGGPHKGFCSDWPGAEAEEDVATGEGEADESGRGVAQRPLAAPFYHWVAAQQSQQREGTERGLFIAGGLSGTDVHMPPSSISSHLLAPAGPGWPIQSTGHQHAGLLPALVPPFSATGHAPQQPMHSSVHEKAAVTVDPTVSCEHRPCPQQPGEPQVRPPFSAWSALGARPRTVSQEQREPKQVKWEGPDEAGWGYRSLPGRYKSMNWRVLRDMEKAAVTCMALTPSLHAREVVPLVVHVTSMAAVELAALAFCPDDVQPRRGEVCNSFIMLLTNITAEGSATLQAARDMGLLNRIKCLASVLKEIRTPPPKTEFIPLETYKIKFTTQMRVGWYAFAGVGALLDGLFPWASEKGITPQKPQNVIRACESIYIMLKERLLASAGLQAWLHAAQYAAKAWVIFSEADIQRQPQLLKKIADAQEDIDKAILEAGCSPVFFGPHQALLRHKAPLDAPTSLQRPRTQIHQPVPAYSPPTSLEPQPVLHNQPETRLPPQLPQQPLLPMWPSSPLIESSLVSPSTLIPPAPPSQILMPPYIPAAPRFPFLQMPLYPPQALQHQAHYLPPWTRPPLGPPLQLPFRLPFFASSGGVSGPSSAQQRELSHTQAPLQASRPQSFAGFHTPPPHPLHQSAPSGTSQEQSGTQFYVPEGIKHHQDTQPSQIPQTGPSAQPPLLVPSAWPWSSAEQQRSGWPPPTGSSFQEAAFMSGAVATPSAGLRGSGASLPEVAEARGEPLQAFHTSSAMQSRSSLEPSPHASGWSLALEKQAAPESLKPIAPTQTPEVAQAPAIAPSLSLPGTSSIWAWSPGEQQVSSWPRSEAFLSHRATAMSEASRQPATGMWGSGAAAAEAEPAGESPQSRGEGEAWSGLESLFDIWSIGDDEDD